DDLDERMIEAFRSLPRELNAVQALRASLGTGFRAIVGEELEIQRARERLLRTEPELRSAMLDEMARTVRVGGMMIGERAGRPADGEEVVTLAGAAIGMAIAAWLGSGTDEWLDHYVDRLDAGLARLESGFNL